MYPFHVVSWSALVVIFQVKNVLTAPATLARTPPVKSPWTMRSCLNGSFSLNTVGIGTKTIRKSVVVLIMPAASKCASSLMHF